MDENAAEFIKSTQKQAMYLWAGLSLSLTLFFAQSQIVFVKTQPLPSSRLEWVFSGMGVATFLLGLVFFKNYLALRKNALLRMPFKDRKQSILIAFVLQFILFETLGLYGVLLSVLSQSTMKAVPFMMFAYLGFYFSFPKQQKVAPYFSKTHHS